jgi:hypothetical protein
VKLEVGGKRVFTLFFCDLLFIGFLIYMIRVQIWLYIILFAKTTYFRSVFVSLSIPVPVPVALQSLKDLCRLTYRRFLELFRHMLGLLGWVISPSQGLYLHRTIQHRKTRTNIHALSGIRTHDPSNQPAKTHASDRTATKVYRLLVQNTN